MGWVVARSPDTVRGPDAAVIRADRLPPGDGTGFLEGAPDLAIEIVSPSNSGSQIREKVSEYLAAGASCVWVIDPRRRTATVHSTDCEAVQLREPDALFCDGVLPGFRLKLSELFGSHSSRPESRSG
jgi:Uma2 family endonuclease